MVANVKLKKAILFHSNLKKCQSFDSKIKKNAINKTYKTSEIKIAWRYFCSLTWRYFSLKSISTTDRIWAFIPLWW